MVAFHRPYKRLGVDKGDERRVERVDHKNRTVHLEGRNGETVELRTGDRIRWTRNDKGLGLVNSGTAEVMGVRNGQVAFELEDGRRLTLTPGDPQPRHLDYAWASTMHAYQGRTVDNVIAVLQANHPTLTKAKAFYVEIRCSRDRAELVTDDAAALKERLETVTGERASRRLKASGRRSGRRPERDGRALPSRERPGPQASAPRPPETEPTLSLRKTPEAEPPARERRVEMDMSL